MCYDGDDRLRPHHRGADADGRAHRQRQAITDTKLDELTREVREHNNFAQRVPVIEEQIKVINHRIQDLENGK